MVQINRFDHVNMKVVNLNESVAFYKDVFNFDTKESGVWNGTPWTIVGLKDQAYLCMYEVGDLPRATDGVRLNHFGFHVENFEEIEEKLKAMGIEVRRGMTNTPVSRSLYIDDPSGFEIELSERVGGGLQ